MLVLRQNTELTDEAQEVYFQTIIKSAFSLAHPPQLLFSFLKQDECIGYGGLVHIDWASLRAEVSFLLETERSKNYALYREEFAIFLHLIKELTFKELRFHRLFTETFDIRPLHILVLEANGFLFEGRMKEHVYIENQFVDSLIHGCINT